ncbi:cryptochrome/photolyase family protein [Maribacter sp. HTCC2170]|uniref:cryptochrome/photolyase family protein n=1 Tax=Maribacter sp. (strain HTCC2170 / KCCM 42371) TaxID=313603 RepID=UPI00006BB854|nr:deoxyribodipyrimidine photo-lyase [Maribacter sp. HTCC2170]EAQ99722.1 deoxyribodipyrimidine photolyase-class I [Maribacter sp. HTCC2170]
MNNKISVFWFRRDLRLEDNTGLLKALQGPTPVLPIFIFDTEILCQVPKNDARVNFIYNTIETLNTNIKKKHKSSIAIFHGKPIEIFNTLIKKHTIDAVFANHDYEPHALKRDTAIKELLANNSISFHTYKDQVIFEKNEIIKSDKSPYVVYTPYKNKWKENFDPKIHLKNSSNCLESNNFVNNTNLPFFELRDIGFESSSITVPEFIITITFIEGYETTRNYPGATNGTSKIGPHLRFGTVSIRKIVKHAINSDNKVFWNELIWREFFMQILWHFPNTVNNAFRPKYDRIEWRNNEAEFEKWKTGQTGYPLVDAGMRELNATGFMHNRVRMLTASFLCKHLLIDWRWGEAYFAEKLLDFDLSANVGNWQWAAGSGVDAAPYFRIFNPSTQIDKFDKQKTYVNQWVPELQEFNYPTQIVDHKFARERCLKVYKEALG